jgi:putative glutamine amidotransferase
VNKRVLIPFRHLHKLKPYEEAARAAGLDPVSKLTNEPLHMDDVAGVLLMGGTDVDPRLYGQEAGPETDQPDRERDEIELDVIDQAIKRDLPILAICRGLQILNVYHGGTLIQHLASSEHHHPENGDRAAPVHEVTIEPDSLLARIAGATRWNVNSRHHQAADSVGANLSVSARDAEDGTIEGLERLDKRFMLAVQWHPEDQILKHPEQLKLFRRFAEAVTKG